MADAVVAYAAAHGRVPVVAGTGPEVPQFVGPGTVVVAVSTGEACEETLAAATTARALGASVLLVAPDGPLSEWADSGGVPRRTLPAVGPVPRLSMSSALVTVLGALSDLGLVDDATASLSSAAAALGRRRDALLALHGPADEMARRIGRTMPLVYGAAGLAGVAARHWKMQMNEHVKTPAFCAVLPDAAHHEVAGWGQHGDVTRQILTLIPLRHHGEDPLVARRFELVLDAMDEVMADVLPVWAEGDDDLGRFLDLALFGDFVALHLAGREGIDPGPVATQL